MSIYKGGFTSSTRVGPPPGQLSSQLSNLLPFSINTKTLIHLLSPSCMSLTATHLSSSPKSSPKRQVHRPPHLHGRQRKSAGGGLKFEPFPTSSPSYPQPFPFPSYFFDREISLCRPHVEHNSGEIHGR